MVNVPDIKDAMEKMCDANISAVHGCHELSIDLNARIKSGKIPLPKKVLGRSADDIRDHLEQKHGQKMERMSPQKRHDALNAHAENNPDDARGVAALHNDLEAVASGNHLGQRKPAMKEGVNTMFPKLSLFTSLIEDGVPSEYQKQVPRGHENTARIKCPWCGDSSKKAFEWENNNGKCAKCHKSLYKPGQRPLAQEALLPEEKEEAVPMGKKEVLAALKDMTPADRKAVHTKLMAMVEADEAEAE